MPDIHALPPTHGRLSLRSVGISGVRKPINVQREDRVVTLTATFDVAVDLPASKKGSDLSRNAELLEELIDETVTKPVSSLESACGDIARELLKRHPYASESWVSGEAEYFLERGISEDRKSLENYRLFAEAHGSRNGEEPMAVVRSIGAEGVGMTACPCAMATAREQLVKEFPLLADPSFASLPIVTHNQRNRTRLAFELPEGTDVEADDLVAAIENAQSSPTFAILKRGDEARLVLNAHRNPKFVEDVVRTLLASLPARFPNLPDSIVAHAETVSEESIHKYNVQASHRTTMGELRSSMPDA